MTNIHAVEPDIAHVKELLMAEIRTDAPKLAAMMFGSNDFADSKQMDKPEYLAHLRWCYVNGATVEGQWIAPEAWCLLQIQRVGEERFMKEITEAWEIPYREVTPNDLMLMTLAAKQGDVVLDWGADAVAMSTRAAMAEAPQEVR